MGAALNRRAGSGLKGANLLTGVASSPLDTLGGVSLGAARFRPF
jgi:hypothetical protein